MPLQTNNNDEIRSGGGIFEQINRNIDSVNNPSPIPSLEEFDITLHQIEAERYRIFIQERQRIIAQRMISSQVIGNTWLNSYPLSSTDAFRDIFNSLERNTDEKINDKMSAEKSVKKKDNGIIVDYITKEEIYITDARTLVITGLLDKKASAITERFELSRTVYAVQNTKLPVVYYGGIFCYVASEELALSLGFIENIEYTVWSYPDEDRRIIQWRERNTFNKFNNAKFAPLEDLKTSMAFGLSSPTDLLSEGKGYTFGVELECSKCYLPNYIASNYNIDCVRDGSLNGGNGGPEIITGVLKGDAGFSHLNRICYELSKRGSVDHWCGMHLHLGNFDFTKENLVYLYKICFYLEKEFFSMVQESRRSNTFCKQLSNLDFKSDINSQDSFDYSIALNDDYEKLLSYISYKPLQRKLFTKGSERNKNHPMGAKCEYNHNTPRYSWVNFVPSIFRTRGQESSKTFEVRLHGGTLNYDKIKNWTLIWMGVLWFVENKKTLITPSLTLSMVMEGAYPKKYGKLNQYIALRKSLFSEDSSESVDYIKEENLKIKSIKDICAL